MCVGNFSVYNFRQGLLDIIYWVATIPLNLGVGLCYPGTLFTFLVAFPYSYQASTTATLYLFRSVSHGWGLAAVSSVIQSFASSRLHEVLKEYEGYEEITTQCAIRWERLATRVQRSGSLSR